MATTSTLVQFGPICTSPTQEDIDDAIAVDPCAGIANDPDVQNWGNSNGNAQNYLNVLKAGVADRLMQEYQSCLLKYQPQTPPDPTPKLGINLTTKSNGITRSSTYSALTNGGLAQTLSVSFAPSTGGGGGGGGTDPDTPTCPEIPIDIAYTFELDDYLPAVIPDATYQGGGGGGGGGSGVPVSFSQSSWGNDLYTTANYLEPNYALVDGERFVLWAPFPYLAIDNVASYFVGKKMLNYARAKGGGAVNLKVVSLPAPPPAKVNVPTKLANRVSPTLPTGYPAFIVDVYNAANALRFYWFTEFSTPSGIEGQVVPQYSYPNQQIGSPLSYPKNPRYSLSGVETYSGITLEHVGDWDFGVYTSLGSQLLNKTALGLNPLRFLDSGNYTIKVGLLGYDCPNMKYGVGYGNSFVMAPPASMVAQINYTKGYTTSPTNVQTGGSYAIDNLLEIGNCPFKVLEYEVHIFGTVAKIRVTNPFKINVVVVVDSRQSGVLIRKIEPYASIEFTTVTQDIVSVVEPTEGNNVWNTGYSSPYTIAGRAYLQGKYVFVLHSNMWLLKEGATSNLYESNHATFMAADVDAGMLSPVNHFNAQGEQIAGGWPSFKFSNCWVMDYPNGGQYPQYYRDMTVETFNTSNGINRTLPGRTPILEPFSGMLKVNSSTFPVTELPDLDPSVYGTGEYIDGYRNLVRSQSKLFGYTQREVSGKKVSFGAIASLDIVIKNYVSVYNPHTGQSTFEYTETQTVKVAYITVATHPKGICYLPLDSIIQVGDIHLYATYTSAKSAAAIRAECEADANVIIDSIKAGSSAHVDDVWHRPPYNIVETVTLASLTTPISRMVSDAYVFETDGFDTPKGDYGPVLCIGITGNYMPSRDGIRVAVCGV